jgi:hypothetical protein
LFWRVIFFLATKEAAMPAIRVVMPNGTTKSFREGTSKSVIAQAKRDMIAAMNEGPEDHEAYRAGRRVEVTGWLSKVQSAKKELDEKLRQDSSQIHPDPETPELEPANQPYAPNYTQKNHYQMPQEEVARLEKDVKGTMNSTGKVLEKGGDIAGVVGAENFAIPLSVGGKVTQFPPVQNFVVDQAVKYINRKRDPVPLPNDWLLRRIIGDRAADAILRATLPQQINNMLGNNVMRQNGGIVPRR